jgi:hypothetical protein
MGHQRSRGHERKVLLQDIKGRYDEKESALDRTKSIGTIPACQQPTRVYLVIQSRRLVGSGTAESFESYAQDDAVHWEHSTSSYRE